MNKNIGVQIIALLIAFLFVFTSLSIPVQSAPPVTQEIIVVDINGNGDYLSIKTAIHNAEATNIIQIRKGTYNENEITVNQKIEIIGEDPENTIIDCSGNTAFILRSAYVDISNLQIINTKEFGIVVDQGSSGCSITNCIVDTNYNGVGIDIRSSYNTISNCSLIGYDTSKQAIKIQGSDNTVTNCDMQDFANGVLILYNSHRNQVINCNIINNENAVDIRIDSNDNIVTGCNIYSNLQSIKIWQSSNRNKVYLNNIWKNDQKAIDENNNSWDDGTQGNYWDTYQGVDSNSDGIGDTPFVITGNNVDRFPIMSLILPDIVTPPSNVKQTTGRADNTPTFTWNPSVYSKGIKGYYVKLDSNPEIFIGDTTTWTSIQALSDGVHTFYVKAVSKDDESSSYTALPFSIDVSFNDADEDGWSDEDEQIYGTDPNDPNNYPIDTDLDHIPDSIDTDDDNDGYSDNMEASYGTDAYDAADHPTDTDGDGIPDQMSPDGKYPGDEDDDGDGLSDSDEATLGSNSLNGSDATRLYISGKTYYIVDINENGYYDVLFEPISGRTSGVERQGTDYLLDADGDGSWDHIYGSLDGSVSDYTVAQILPLAVWIIVILAALIIGLYIASKYFRRRTLGYGITRRPRRAEERPLIKKPIRISPIDKDDTMVMVSQTKMLLQNIQQDVEVYMDKLSEIEDQFRVTKTKQKQEPLKPPIEEIKLPEEKPTKVDDKSEIESKVDKLLADLEDKDKN